MTNIKSDYNVIQAPLITEKATDGRANSNKYSFYVDVRANKLQIKTAVEQIFKVNVISVNTQMIHPKPKRLGKYMGMTGIKKKAVVTLKQGDSIKLMEGP